MSPWKRHKKLKFCRTNHHLEFRLEFHLAPREHHSLMILLKLELAFPLLVRPRWAPMLNYVQPKCARAFLWRSASYIDIQTNPPLNMFGSNYILINRRDSIRRYWYFVRLHTCTCSDGTWSIFQATTQLHHFTNNPMLYSHRQTIQKRCSIYFSSRYLLSMRLNFWLTWVVAIQSKFCLPVHQSRKSLFIMSKVILNLTIFMIWKKRVCRYNNAWSDDDINQD